MHQKKQVQGLVPVLSLHFQGQETREKRIRIFSCHMPNSVLGPTNLFPFHHHGTHLWGRTVKPFHWWGHWGFVKCGEHDYLIPKPLITTLYNSFRKSKCGGDRSCLVILPGLGWQLSAGHWSERPIGWVLLLWEQLKSEESRSSHHVERRLFLLFTLVKSPESILDLEYLFFNQIQP